MKRETRETQRVFFFCFDDAKILHSSLFILHFFCNFAL